jgi:hypothetical protein
MSTLSKSILLGGTNMKKWIKKQLKFGIFGLIFFFSILTSSTFGKSVFISGNNTSIITGRLSSELPNTWEESQYDFYQTLCPFGETVVITLNYEGNLDLDLVIFVDETSFTEDQHAYAWDIAHCDFNLEKHPPKSYSRIATTNTSIDGEEMVVYTNVEFDISRKVYILVFAEKGTGNSNYILECANPITLVPNADYEDCRLVLYAWILFGVSIILVSLLIFRIAKRALLTPEQKAEIAAKKAEDEKEKAVKAKLSGKSAKPGKTSMSARRGDTRR